MNRIVIYIVITQVIVCSIIAIIGGMWYAEEKDGHEYLMLEFSATVSSTLNFFTYFLLMNTLLPISLIVSLEVIKIA